MESFESKCICGGCFDAFIYQNGECRLDAAYKDSKFVKSLQKLSRVRKSFIRRGVPQGGEPQTGVTVSEASTTSSSKNDSTVERAKGNDNSGFRASFGEPAFIAIVAACSAAGLVGLVVAGVCWYKLQRNVKAASETDYPAYGVTGPAKRKDSNSGDRKLAQSAQMYHYQHQKQQMLAMEKANSEKKEGESDVDSEDEKADGDFTVYECPGLAPAGQLEVNNPLFSEEKAEKTEDKK